MPIQWIGSPNFTVGREGHQPELVVLHHSAGTLQATDAVFQNTTRDTSAHYAIGQGGEVHQYVREGDIAYHAGVWDINLRSIGIEHIDNGVDTYTDIQYQTSVELIASICQRYGFQPSTTTIRPHHDFFNTACPGKLDVQRLINGAIVKLTPPQDMSCIASPEDVDKYYHEILERAPENSQVTQNREWRSLVFDSVPELQANKATMQTKIDRLQIQITTLTNNDLTQLTAANATIADLRQQLTVAQAVTPQPVNSTEAVKSWFGRLIDWLNSKIGGK
jgi:hypothetical protein